MGEFITLCNCYVSVFSSAHMTTLKQSSHFESANVGGSVTLPCLCQDHITVMFYWYKQTLGEKPKLVLTFYKHSNNSGNFYDEFKNNPRFTLDIGRHTNYLKISDLLVSDSATYYCAMSNLYTYEFCEGTTVKISLGAVGAKFTTSNYNFNSSLIFCSWCGLWGLGVFLERCFGIHHHPGCFAGFLNVQDAQKKLRMYR
uniref:Ig-like domain-containing protein n=1 Tax=Monopterus albus TaxID=43700 RepID=A0A3Q3IHD7_MONAL